MYYPVEEIRVSNGELLRKLDFELHVGLRSPQDVFEKGGRDPVVREGIKLTKAIMARVKAAGVKEISVKPDDLVGRAVLTELMDQSSREVILEKNQRLTLPVLEKIVGSRIGNFKVIYLDNPLTSPVILDTLDSERTGSREEAWVEIYKRLRPGEMP